MNWREAEAWLAEQVGGTVVKDRAKQLVDIDVEGPGGTFSVKTSPAVARYGNFSFEQELERSDNGARMDGNFRTCAADWYVIVVPPWQQAYAWPTELLRQAVAAKAYPVKPLKTSTEGNNGGRTWDRSWSSIVPARDLASSAFTWPVHTARDTKDGTSAPTWMLPWPS